LKSNITTSNIKANIKSIIHHIKGSDSLIWCKVEIENLRLIYEEINESDPLIPSLFYRVNPSTLSNAAIIGRRSFVLRVIITSTWKNYMTLR